MSTPTLQYHHRTGIRVLGTFIDALDWNETLDQITEWSINKSSRIVCLCNAHSSVTAISEPSLAAALSISDMVLPDGAPIAWMMRRKGYNKQSRIAGPDLMYKLCKNIENTDQSVFLFGSSNDTLVKLVHNLTSQLPYLNIRGSLSPSYGHWTQAEEQAYINAINESGAEIIFVGLGCPKQEIWMANNRHNICGVMLGVGAAFDFHAGTIERAPEVFQHLGLEWLHRLFTEPGRLWKRYLVTNTKFIYLSALELLKIKIL